jgi:hypothetical protein
MLTSLLLTDNDTLNVTYKTDLPEGATTGNFTVMDIQDLNDAEKHLGFDFKQLPSNIEAFKAFALENNLVLIRVDGLGKAVLVNYTDESSSSLLDELW